MGQRNTKEQHPHLELFRTWLNDQDDCWGCPERNHCADLAREFTAQRKPDSDLPEWLSKHFENKYC